MKTNKLISRLTKLTVALSLAVSILPASIMTANAAKTETLDWCLDESGSIRQGVEITAHYTKTDGTEQVFNAADNGKADGDSSGSNDPLSRVLTSQQSYWGGGGTPGFWIGWKTNSVKDSYYIQVDLGEIRNINEIGFVPYGSGDTWWRTNQIYLSNDKNFETQTEVTDGATLFNFKEMTTYTYSLEETKSYRYIRICTYPGDVILGASKLVVKGTNIIEAEDLLHDKSGNLKAVLSASHPGYEGENGKLADINNIADGKYELDYTSGSLDMDKATSFISNFGGASEKWVQADLGEVKAIESIRVLLYPGTVNEDVYFRQNVKIIGSNDPEFNNFTVLAQTDKTHETRGVWLEYKDDDYSGRYRYIRVVRAGDVIGVTELEVKGYELCEAFLTYTNFDKYLVTETNTSPQAVSNVSNADSTGIITWMNSTRDAVINNRLQLIFSGNVDAETVNENSLTVKNTYKTGADGSNTVTLNYTSAVEGNVIYIDLCDFNSNADVELNITDKITVDGINVTPQKLNFKTGVIAPVPYQSGKVIKNVALAKKVMTSTTDKTAVDNIQNGKSHLTDNYCSDAAYKGKYAVIDLGNEYDIAAYGIATTISWHIDCYNVFMSDSWESLTSTENQVYNKDNENYGSRQHANKKLGTAKKTRYITLQNEKANGENILEFLAYTYMPAESENGVYDAYFSYNGSKPVFIVEKNADSTCKIMAARYNRDGTLVDVNTADGNKIAFDASVTDEQGSTVEYTVKTFVWNDMEKIEPIIPAVVY